MRQVLSIYAFSCIFMILFNIKLQGQNNFSFSYLNGDVTHHYNLINKGTNVVMCENVEVTYTSNGANTYNSIYQYERTQAPNPFSVLVPHLINTSPGQIEVSPISIMDPIICRYNPTNSSISYSGSPLVYYTNMNVGQLLPDAIGTATISCTNGFNVVINIQIGGRQLLCMREVMVNGQLKQIFTFANQLHYNVVSQGISVHSVDETVKIDVIQGGGMYSIERNSPFGSTFLQFIN